jgi:hypothetical protein
VSKFNEHLAVRMFGLYNGRMAMGTRKKRERQDGGQKAARKAAENQGFCLANEIYLELLG